MRIAVWCCAAMVVVALTASPAFAENPIQAENALPGDSYWTAATHDPTSSNPPIAGYAGSTSVRPGGTIAFHVSTNPVARYRIEISRLGWYGGSGGRRITCLVGSVIDLMCSKDHLGVEQASAPPPDPATGETRAGWTATDTLTVPAGWVSGYYLAVFRLTSGPSSGQTGFTPFIVRAPSGDRSAILVQVPTNTWQAYNAWGGRDFYTTPPAVKVSFDRPYADRQLFDWEYPLARFLERGGWDVSYATDNDVDADPGILLDHALDMTAGHGEYWTKAMRDGWEAARAAGVNLAFMGANTGFWQVRYEDGDRTLVGYKYAPDPDPDPAEKTTQFRWLQPARPECQLEGVQFQGAIYHGNVDYSAGRDVATDPWFAGTGLTVGSVLPGVVGYELDAITPGCHVPPVTPLLGYSGPAFAASQPPARADAVRYIACSGAEVFSSGSMQFSWGLDSWRDPAYFNPLPASVALQRAMTQALGDLTKSHVPAPGPPHICTPSTGFTASVAQAVVGQPVVFTSMATDPYGQIASEKWDLAGDGGFDDANGATATRTFAAPGVAQIGLRVTDSSGAASTTVKTLPVCVCPAPGQPQVMTPPGAPNANPCPQTAIGSLRVVKRRVWFEPATGVTAFTIRTYRITRTAKVIHLVRLATHSVFRSKTAVPIRSAHAPLVIDVTMHAARRFQRQQFLLPYRPAARPIAPGPLTSAACDGTSGRVLTPWFGGPRSSPLRVSVIGRGRLTVSLARPGARTRDRRSVTIRGGASALSFAPGGLPAGVYHLTITVQHPLPGSGPLVLAALRL